MTELKNRKLKEKESLEKDLDKIVKDFLAMNDYQKSLAETAELREKIEQAKVTIQFLDIQVSLLTEATEMLTQKRDDLSEEKKLADGKNEELKTQLRAQEEVANKRLQNKLNREKSAEIKELLANEEMIKAANEDIMNKLRAEKETYDNILTDKMKLHETLERLQEEFKLDTETVKEQDALLAELKKQIEIEQLDVDNLEEKQTESKQVNKVEEERHRRVQQEYTALTAKMEFIEDPEHYDYTSTPEDIGKNLHLFKDL